MIWLTLFIGVIKRRESSSIDMRSNIDKIVVNFNKEQNEKVCIKKLNYSQDFIFA